MGPVAPPRVVLVAADPLWCAQLVQALLQDGFQVLQRPGSQKLQSILPAAGDQPPQLLVLHGSQGCSDDEQSLTDLVLALRRREPALPMLLLLDQAEEAQRVAFLDAGADDVLQQPFGLREVVARCRAILRRSRGAWAGASAADAQDLLEVGPICLDRRQCRVTLAGEEVILTPREFRLLECFMINPGLALSREQLIEQVWGPDYGGDSKSVDVHVLWLRRKLDVAGPRPQLFITVRGIGYRLDPPRD
jgi:two-component system, OmpR family, phosphate regulon response regulator PhoB